VVAGLIAAAGAQAITPAEIPIGDFWKHAEFINIQISPDGEHLAAIVPEDTTRSLVVFRRVDRKVTGVARFTDKRQVAQFIWVSPKRLAFTMSDRDGRLVAPQQRGELLFMNVDGKETTAYGGQARGSVLTNALRDDDDYVIVTDFLPSQRGEGGDQTVSRVNTKTAKSRLLASSPVRSSNFLVTRDGEPRVAWGENEYDRNEVWYREGEGVTADWSKIFAQKDTGRIMTPWVMDGDGEHFFAMVTEKTGPSTLYRVDALGNLEQVVRDAVTQPTDYQPSLDGKELIAVTFGVGQPRREYLKPKHPDATLLSSLEKSFPGQWVELVNATKDGQIVVFTVQSDRNSGEFYLYDRGTRKATYLASAQEWLDPDLMAPMKAISYKARDGRTIHGWLTLPKDSKGKNLPLIVNPHGGPFGLYDVWEFSEEVQLFASRGYAVLQPNFRGSGGFGREFEEAGYRHWGGAMQDDLTDATKWAIAEGIADVKRVCIMGTSYGAYAALMGVAKEPELYQCAVGFVGVYDMNAMDSRGDVSESNSGQAFLKRVLGTDKGALNAASPSMQAAKVKAAVFLAAGEKDRRAPPVHTQRMYDALKDAGNTPETKIIQDGEAHGYYEVKNNVKLYTQMLAFFDKHIGAGAK
jgi:dipeptidyl aminopeptidase/acylaminoacyl peptidase